MTHRTPLIRAAACAAALALPAAAAASPAPTARARSTAPNVVVIVADDFGVDLVAAYGEAPDPPCTPNLDQLAAGGLLFRNAWATPTCASTRAALLTGRFGFRTGMGAVGAGALSKQEVTLAEALTTHESHAIGKWHLAAPNDLLDPNDQGFARFAGFSGGAVGSYTSWTRIENGVANPETSYTTTVITDDALTSLGTMQEPWFLYVAYNAPHTPWEVPPAGLCPPAGACPNGSCASLSAGPTTPELVKAMSEALDTEIGRLLDAVFLQDPAACVIFVGDNGTAGQASEPPFLGSHAKGQVYEGGLNVPFLVKGPGVTPGETAGLVSVVDVFATVMELAGLPCEATDSVSLVPYFADPDLSLRAAVYAESFSPNNTPAPYAVHEQALRGERYKLIRRAGAADEFYDLWQDPFETSDLWPGLSLAEQQAYGELEDELEALFSTPPIAYCTAGTSASGCRASMHGIGTASATDPDGFTLSVQSVESGRPGLFFFGTSGRQASPWGNGTSYQCVVPPVARTPLFPPAGPGGACTGARALDLNALWCPACPAAAKNPGSGAVVQAQFWYRDQQNTSNQSTSLSNGFEFTLAP